MWCKNESVSHAVWKQARHASSPEEIQYFGSPLSSMMDGKNLDKYLGCLIGGAAGDALGYAIEFASEDRIFSQYGPEGISNYRLTGGIAQISDDTQMTLFTANGVLLGKTRRCLQGALAPMYFYIGDAYRAWYNTQIKRYPLSENECFDCWLCGVPELFSPRAPGMTCIGVLSEGSTGSLEHPCNQSKGCGGVMRVAPIGLFYDEHFPALQVDLLGADAAALTHGHELGWLPAAMLVHMVWLLSHSSNISLLEAVRDGQESMKKLFFAADHLERFLRLTDRAVELSQMDCNDLDAIHSLGEGWVAEETLAIAIYCSLRYEKDFDKAIRTAVNHRGDSDSTGAVTGNLLGAHLGLSHIPLKYTEHLELRDAIMEIGEDLYDDCTVNGNREPKTEKEKAWFQKYVLPGMHRQP